MTHKLSTSKGTFILRCDFYSQVKLLEREQRGDLLMALFAYTSGDTIPKLDSVTSMCFEFIRASIDTYSDKYDEKCQKNRENGKRGGRPRKPDGIDENQPESDKTERFNLNPNATEKTDRLGGKPNVTEWLELKPPESEKTERVKKNHYSYSDTDTELDITSNNSTHTLSSVKEGGAGETNLNHAAREIIAWVEANAPTIAAMAEPLTEQHAVWMLRKYSVEDIHRIISAMHNKRGYKNVNAYATFSNFVKYDKELNERKAVESSNSKPFTWDGMLDYIDKHPGTTTAMFERQVRNGSPVWFKKSDVSINQQPRA